MTALVRYDFGGGSVAPAFACPHCRESRMDYLLIDDSDAVRCSTCGCEYVIAGDVACQIPRGMTHLVTLNATPAWQPTTADTGKTCEWWAALACYRVETDHGATQHGMWTTEEQAARFAASMGGYGNPRAVKCEPYLYAPAFGVCDGYPARKVVA